MKRLRTTDAKTIANDARRYGVLVIVALALCMLRVGAAQTPASPIVILISFDGWRWDYIDRANVPNMRALAKRGVRSDGLIPSFPSKTFPNHYTLVTGLYPDHHGIVSNNMWDPIIGQRFTMDADTAKDPRWWGGEPLWVTAIRQGKHASSMFWPGSEVAIDDVRPTDWKKFDSKFPNSQRVRQVLDWLDEPEAKRPSFITLYFEEVDNAGHTYGPDARETMDAAADLDRELGALIAGVQVRRLQNRVTIIAAADHGMSLLAPSRTIFLDDYVDLTTVDVIDWTPVLAIAPKSGAVDQLYAKLKGKHPAMTVYRKEDLPPELHYGTHPRVPPVLGLADDGWMITSHERFEKRRDEKHFGEHGYDPRYQSMHALFIAAGPSLKQGLTVARFQNIHVYDLMCRILGLTPAKNDGDMDATKAFMR